jgi:hypothetical protein
MKKIILFFLILLLNSCNILTKWQIEAPDNFLEEQLEDILECKTGQKIDLTPFTGKEKKEFDIFKKEF